MTKHEDEIEIFIPKCETQIIILGTMGSINARTINGKKPTDAFYYNNNKNQFWNVIQLLFDPKIAPKKLTIAEKKAYLEKWGIAMNNIVQEAEVDDSDALDPSDTVLFQAHKKGNLTFKNSPDEFRELLKVKPMFFTCRHKNGITDLLQGYFEFNQLDASFSNSIWFWPTPTRCNAKDRSLIWKKEMDKHLKD